MEHTAECRKVHDNAAQARIMAKSTSQLHNETMDQIFSEQKKFAEFFTELASIAAEIADEYPNIKTCPPHEQLYAIKSSYDGAMAANDDCHLIINYFRQRCGLSRDELAEIWEREIKAREAQS